MKTVKQSMIIILGILFITLQGCTHTDYVPVPGPAGANGTNGVAGTTSCETCHSAAHRDPIIAAFGLSGHNAGISVNGVVSKHVFGTNTTFADGSLNSDRAFCSQCHSQEGYIDNAKYGKPNPTGYNNVQSISCEGCHGTTHRSFNFSVDGNDFGLRQIAATTQKINPAFTINASPTDGKSSSNTCITCHQIRPDSNGFYKRPVIESAEKDASGAVVITNDPVKGPLYRFWSQRKLANASTGYPAGTTYYKNYSNTGIGAHESPQADIWMGITGIDIEGTTTHLPAAKTAAHYKSNSCVSCHMDTPKAGTVNTGSHSLELSFVSCTKCHTSPETLLTTFHTDFDAKLENLRLALSAKSDYFTTNATSGAIGVKSFDSTTNIAFPTTPASGTTTATTWYQSRTDFPLKYVQAYWNYKMLSGDPSRGVHNPLYVKALIQNSIEALK